jgi:xanthine dehydrogenase molybdopterin-binding subunit B
MLALSAFHAIRDAIAGDDSCRPDLVAPATPENILRALQGAGDE